MTVRVMLSLPKTFLDQVDEAARLEYRSRSDLMREALRRYLEQRRENPEAAPKQLDIRPQ